MLEASIEHATTDDLNFASGESLRRLKAILTQDQLHEARERICEDMDNSKSIKDQLKARSWLSAGILFKSISTRLGKTVFDICREKIKDKRQQAIDKMRKEEDKCKRNVHNATKDWKKKSDVEKMTIHELTIIVCKPLKRKSDGKMPNKKEDLLLKLRSGMVGQIQCFISMISMSEMMNY